MNKISPFTSVYHKGNYVFLFNHLTLERHYTHKKDYNSILKNDDLLKKGLTVDETFNEEEYFCKTKDILLENQKEPKISVCYLLLTSDCNYDCRYCLIRSNTKEKSYMTSEMVKKAVDFFQKNMDTETKKKMIYFYGGEPLLNFQVLKVAVEEARRIIPGAMLILVTNGALLTKEIADFLIRNKIYISLSIDGPEDLNNKARVTLKNNKESFKLAIEGFNTLKHRGRIPSVLCTVGSHNVNHIEKIVSFFIEELKVKYLGFVLQKRTTLFPNTNPKKVARQMIRGFETATLNQSTIDNFRTKRLLPFVTKNPRIKDCAGYGRQVIITPEGKVGPCHAFWPLKKFLDLTVDSDTKVTEHKTWREWNQRVTYNEPRCKYCEAISLCGGGCAFNYYNSKEEIWNIDKTICGFTKEILRWLIWAWFERQHREEIKLGDKKLIIKLPSWTDDKRYEAFIKKSEDKTLKKKYPYVKSIIKTVYEDKGRFLFIFDKSEILGVAYSPDNCIFLNDYKNDELIRHVLRKLKNMNQIYLTGELRANNNLDTC